MTAVDANADVTSTPASTRARYSRRRTAFGQDVAATVAMLQATYRKKMPSAVAAMAQLRVAATKEPGQQYSVLDQTFVPDEFMPTYAKDDQATDVELAKHTAVTLYAIHQQSIYNESMHQDGQGLGLAVNQLATKKRSHEDAVRRRFGALGTSSSYNETVIHLRGLIRQLRDERIALDYGLLADDLVALQRPEGQHRVRARWGREYYRTNPADAIASTAVDAGATSVETDEE